MAAGTWSVDDPSPCRGGFQQVTTAAVAVVQTLVLSGLSRVAWEKERQKERKTEGYTHPFILKTATRLTFFRFNVQPSFFSESPFGLLATLRSAARAANVHWLCSIIIAVSTPPPSLQRVKERGSRGRPLIARGSEV